MSIENILITVESDKNKKLMTIFAHQDDETFSAGGVLSKYGKNHSSFAVSITFDPNRELEFISACQKLGASPIQLKFDRISKTNEGEIRSSLIDIIRKYQPNIVITHLDYDYHHEHKLTRSIVEEAVEWAAHTTTLSKAHQIDSLWAAETTILIPFPTIFIEISSENENRLDAIRIYESQSHKGGQGFYREFHETRTRLRGIQSGVAHAEAFENVPINISGSFKPKQVYTDFPF
ncbi:MAG: PIG-L family deacetylase [Candidatus Heimdallarchaeota archaeon]|nr:PIG-L family deacetylase [Candidatus Heimdallarchaeota archaeon]